jgi:hypothetical protein
LAPTTLLIEVTSGQETIAELVSGLTWSWSPGGNLSQPAGVTGQIVQTPYVSNLGQTNLGASGGRTSWRPVRGIGWRPILPGAFSVVLALFTPSVYVHLLRTGQPITWSPLALGFVAFVIDTLLVRQLRASGNKDTGIYTAMLIGGFLTQFIVFVIFLALQAKPGH